MARIKKLQENNKSYYPATIALAVKDANFKKSDNSVMTLSEINSQISNFYEKIARVLMYNPSELAIDYTANMKVNFMDVIKHMGKTFICINKQGSTNLPAYRFLDYLGNVMVYQDGSWVLTGERNDADYVEIDTSLGHLRKTFNENILSNVVLTLTQYDALESKDANTLYYITDYV